jgi:hypothetical protein
MGQDSLRSVAHDVLLSQGRAAALAFLCEHMTLVDALSEVEKRHYPEPGDVLSCSWGYDQTNVDWYQVIRATPSSIWIRKIRAEFVGGTQGTDYVVGIKDAFIPDEEDGGKRERRYLAESGAVRRWHKTSDGYGCSIESYSSAYLWYGKPLYQTAWGYGH